MDFLRIARITVPHALKGALKIDLITDIIERFSPGSIVYVGRGSAVKEYRVASCKTGPNNTAILFLEGVSDRNASEAMKGMEIMISSAQAEETRDLLDNDEFYYADLIGCTVIHDGREIGTVTGIMQAGGDILEITGAEREYLIPFTESMVNTDRLRERLITVFPVPGLFD